MEKKKEVKKALLEGFLIDPFKQSIDRIEIANDLDVWRKVMRCEWVDCVRLTRRSERTNDTELDLWVDEEGLLAEVPAPRFKLQRGLTFGGGTVEICGYGLIFSSDAEGNTISLKSDPVSTALFVQMCELCFEICENNPRFDGVDTEFLEEKLRMIELELPGEFRFLSDNE